MPELPEVETTVRGLQPHLLGTKIIDVRFHRDNLRTPLDKDWIPKINGQSINQIKRRAKVILMHLDNAYLAWHLGMSGSMRVCAINEPLRKHDHIEFIIENAGKQRKVLRFHDPRRFGYLKYTESEAELLKPIEHYGPEPFSDEFNADYLYSLCQNKTQAIKSTLMDQTVVVGVGNIYACEALFLAGISPKRSSKRIAKKRLATLINHVQNVLNDAIKAGGTTLQDFESAEAKPGYFQQSLNVYGKAGKPCPHCFNPIQSQVISGRNTFYCKYCQY